MISFEKALQPAQSDAQHKVLRNTYFLLGITLAWSAITAVTAIALNAPSWLSLSCSLIALVMIFFLRSASEGPNALAYTFVFTGLIGAGMAPTISSTLALENGTSTIALALLGTATIFMGLSGYALRSRKDFSYMGGFLLVGLLVAIVFSVANIFFQLPALSLAISAAIVIIMSGFILYDTSRIIHGGETNYVRATISLYLNIINLFQALLNLARGR